LVELEMLICAYLIRLSIRHLEANSTNSPPETDFVHPIAFKHKFVPTMHCRPGLDEGPVEEVSVIGNEDVRLHVQDVVEKLLQQAHFVLQRGQQVGKPSLSRAYKIKRTKTQD